ncbi:MAG: glutamine--tRNA ligase/YqeY domain fusion protein [Verrucomicrobiota bacterium]|nr:glutamine--tRNA ligase/YqeY domain fusion protein [Verrucomicrobiota bacterium]
MSPNEAAPSLDFIREIVARDLETGKNGNRVVTRFPPEPNGYLHIGHAKSICLNFGIAQEQPDGIGRCHLRFDDTNPEKEELEYIQSIKRDVRWLGFDWGQHEYYASDYFDRLYELALKLIRDGKAYVDDQSAEEIRSNRGTLTEPGTPSPFRDRSVEENLGLFERMRAGEFPEGACVLRAKIDMASPNLCMRDPALYRIKKASHHRTGDKWCIYPMYDFTHCLSDSFEGITHSICTLEFENNRPLYDWVLDATEVPCHPQQIEFARLNLTYTVMSKRKLLSLVREGRVNGWDDPRMPTLSGMRRRGFTPRSIRNFCDRIGVAKRENTIDYALLEHCLREDLNQIAPRVMGVLEPLKVVIENYPDDQVEYMEAVNNPEDPSAGVRSIPFSKVLYIERDDFREDPPKKFFRLSPGREVRLRYGYFITCQEVIKDERTGAIKELRCTYAPETRNGNAPDGRKVKGTLHWVSADHAVPVEVRMYDRLFDRADPDGGEGDFRDYLNPDSLKILHPCFVEPGLMHAQPGEVFQFERQGYFCVDPDSTEGNLIFNRTAALRDSWAKIENK